MNKSKELLELELKHKYHYIWDDLISKSKLELISLLAGRDDRLGQKHNDDEWNGEATINIYAGGELKHTIKFLEEDSAYGLSKDAAFECARQLEAQYIERMVVRTEVLFTQGFDI